MLEALAMPHGLTVRSNNFMPAGKCAIVREGDIVWIGRVAQAADHIETGDVLEGSEDLGERLRSVFTQIEKLKRRFDKLPPLRISEREFLALPEYSASRPTGVRHGKRWRRHDGAHDERCPRDACLWVVCEYEVVEEHEDGTISYREHRYRPVFKGEPVAALFEEGDHG